MLFIYRPLPNRIIRNLIRPFASILPEKFWIPVFATFKVSIESGNSVWFTTNPTSYGGRLLFYGGERYFEWKMLRIYKELVQDAEVFFDIGANLGFYSLVGTAMQPELKVYAFEASPGAAKYLKKNVELNHFTNLEVVDKAVSNDNGKIRFYSILDKKYIGIEDHLHGDGTINPDFARKSEVKEVEVPTITLDSFVTSHHLTRLDLMKVDAEASEDKVFAGGMETLRRFRPLIFCEIIPGKIEDKLLQQFSTLQYKYFRILDQGIVEVPDFRSDNLKYIDYLLVPAEKTDRVQRFLIPA